MYSALALPAGYLRVMSQVTARSEKQAAKSSDGPPAAPPILLVEDFPDDAVHVRRALRAAHVANPVRECHTGAATRRLVEEEQPAPVLCLIDVNLPGDESTLEWLRWFQSHPPRLGDIPTIVLRGGDMPVDERRNVPAAVRFVPKPLTADALLDAVQQLGLQHVFDTRAGDPRWLILRPPITTQRRNSREPVR